MKKVFLGVILMVSATSVMAKDYGAAGCGIGSQIFDGQTGLGPHVLAATTNGFYGTQTFAMTSGTLGCDVNGTIKSHSAALYINGNMDNVASAVAKGEGEALEALADAFAIDIVDQSTFKAVLKANFVQIYSDNAVTADEVYSSIIAVMQADGVLSKYAV